MVKTLYLIRHGETVGGEVTVEGDEKRYKGSLDIPLSERGIEQIRRTADFLCTVPIKAVYTSPLSRALRSAEVISERHGLRPIVVPELRERNFGIWEGMSFLEIKEKYPVEFEKWANNPLSFGPPHGESTLEVRDRVIRAIDGIINNCQDNFHVVIVAHGGVNRIIICELLGIPLENIFRIEQSNGCVNIIEFHERHPVVKLLNGVFYG